MIIQRISEILYLISLLYWNCMTLNRVSVFFSSSFPFAVRRRVPTTTIFYILSYPGPVVSFLVTFFLFYVPVLVHVYLFLFLLLVLPPALILVFFPNPSLLHVHTISTFSFPSVLLLIIAYLKLSDFQFHTVRSVRILSYISSFLCICI